MRKRMLIVPILVLLLLLFPSCGKQAEQSASGDKTLFTSGLLAVRKGDRWGYVDRDFKLVIDLKFASAGSFNEYGIAKVGERDSDGNMLYGYINTKGEYVIKPKFQYTEPFENGCAYVVEGDDHYYINPKGEKTEAPPEIDKKKEKSFEVYCIENKYGYKKPDGNTLTKAIYEKALSFSYGYAAVKYDGKWGYIDETGKYYIEPAFDEALRFAEDGIARVRLGKKWGFIDTDGYFLIEPKFDTAEDFAPCGLACVSIGGKYGYVDKNGNYSITLKYSQASSFDEYGYARISNDPPDKCWNFPCICDFYLINIKENKMVRNAYSNYSTYSDGYVIAYEHWYGGKFSIVDSNGNVLLTEDDYDQVDGIAYYLV